MTDTDHYHVIAIQDWGGSQEYWRGSDEHYTQAQARQFADDAIRADDLWWSKLDFDRLEAEFGERWHELISSNVNPGWEAVFIVDCPTECRFDELFSSNWREFGEPYWTAGAPIDV
jgi:hypothetical protein